MSGRRQSTRSRSARSKALPKCTLCDNESDPRMWVHDSPSARTFPLCDGCSPDYRSASDILRVRALCKAKNLPAHTEPLALPDEVWREVYEPFDGHAGYAYAIRLENGFPLAFRNERPFGGEWLGWRINHGENSAFREWAMAERARAEAAETELRDLRETSAERRAEVAEDERDNALDMLEGMRLCAEELGRGLVARAERAENSLQKAKETWTAIANTHRGVRLSATLSAELDEVLGRK